MPIGWRRRENCIDIKAGNDRDALVGIIHGGKLIAYENPMEHLPIYIRRRPFPRTAKHPGEAGVFDLVGETNVSVKVLDAEAGKTLLEKSFGIRNGDLLIDKS